MIAFFTPPNQKAAAVSRVPLSARSRTHPLNDNTACAQFTYPYLSLKVKSHAGIAVNGNADAIAKHQAIQDDNTPANTTFPCVKLEGNPFHETIWLYLRKLPAPMQVNQNAPTHLPRRFGKADTES
eukprot:1138012-Pelagomonas_calceolata.AAC.7